jgi:hypothetical protein
LLLALGKNTPLIQGENISTILSPKNQPGLNRRNTRVSFPFISISKLPLGMKEVENEEKRRQEL